MRPLSSSALRATVLSLSVWAVSAPALADDPADPVPSSAAPEAGGWQYSFSPNLWGAGLQGTLAAGGVETDFDVGFGDIFDALDFAFLGAGEARNGKLSLTGNLIYMQLSTELSGATGSVLPPAPPGDFEVDARMRTLILEGVVGYEVAKLAVPSGGGVAFDLRGGFRFWYLHNDVEVTLDPGSPFGPFSREIESSSEWADLVVGGRLRADLSAKLGLVLAGDVGGFGIGSSSDLTWSVWGFFTYRVSDHWRIALGYRSLDIDRARADVRMQGPLLGGTYQF